MALLKLNDHRPTHSEDSMSNRTPFTQAASQPHLEDMLMGDVDLDFLFGFDAEGDDDMDDLPLQAQVFWPNSLPLNRH